MLVCRGVVGEVRSTPIHVPHRLPPTWRMGTEEGPADGTAPVPLAILPDVVRRHPLSARLGDKGPRVFNSHSVFLVCRCWTPGREQHPAISSARCSMQQCLAEGGFFAAETAGPLNCV